ncbi:hypothetical protein Dgeo_3061 (plasmid) [Deinococcus geothermalis DSM 11300]|uniref:Uncharacterized protein n=1 Tax=Deinococcus geothermalis (strain DSM 11300 / CIP 105573 / AG-3a) TaxID=319795 RepID=A8ZRJ3_DEIGD|nr:hypothetical protein [Deinococcus geothermalis]ABW35102.1 hypothetical protein Dgeo_3061 [Deinococcus geothermalis DSM 11300]
MARKRVAPFDPPTASDFEALGRERVRAGPKGGFVWVCEVDGCKVVASHLSAKGRKVCHRHGGSTAKQRDPEAHAEAVAKGEEPPRPPGRPVRHGFYSVVPGVKVDELVEAYRESGLDPDGTDDDMLYLRAYLDELKLMRPDAREAATLLQEGLVLMRGFLRYLTDEVKPMSGKQMSVREAFEVAGQLETFTGNLDGLRELTKVLLALTAGLEERHANLITLAKVRAETRLKNAAAAQLDAFTVMVERLNIINAETLPSNYAEALQARYAKELSELPGRAVKGLKS